MVNQFSRKALILTVATTAIWMSGCANTGNNGNTGNAGTAANNMRQQAATIMPQQTQQPGDANNRIQVADKAAARIVSLPNVQSANVLVTQRNAYVAAVLKNNQQLSREVEDQIAEQVRSTDANIQNVYVSTNPDLTDRFNAYVQDVQQGRPVAGFVDQFNEMVQRIFPNAR